jgi:hypothetical protein
MASIDALTLAIHALALREAPALDEPARCFRMNSNRHGGRAIECSPTRDRDRRDAVTAGHDIRTGCAEASDARYTGSMGCWYVYLIECRTGSVRHDAMAMRGANEAPPSLASSRFAHFDPVPSRCLRKPSFTPRERLDANCSAAA